MTNVVNRIGFPDETPCPDCGRPITGEEDALGVVYQCTSLDCGSTYAGKDLFPESYREEKTPPPMTPPKDQAPGLVAHTDKLVSALRNKGRWWPGDLTRDAANRIEQLEAENAELRGKIEDWESRIEDIEWSVNTSLTEGIRKEMSAVIATEQANIRSPVQSQIREPYEGEDGA